MQDKQPHNSASYDWSKWENLRKFMVSDETLNSTIALLVSRVVKEIPRGTENPPKRRKKLGENPRQCQVDVTSRLLLIVVESFSPKSLAFFTMNESFFSLLLHPPPPRLASSSASNMAEHSLNDVKQKNIFSLRR